MCEVEEREQGTIQRRWVQEEGESYRKDVEEEWKGRQGQAVDGVRKRMGGKKRKGCGLGEGKRMERVTKRMEEKTRTDRGGENEKKGKDVDR